MTLSEYEKRHLSKGEAQSKEDAFNIDTLGIAYTPVEIVNFMVRSVSEIMKSDFDTSLGSEDVEVIDPFTGTGRFLVGLMQTDTISDDDLRRKYREGEIKGQEILPDSRQIAKDNVEQAYSDRIGEYTSYPYIKLGDTFQDGEKHYAKKHSATTKKTQEEPPKAEG